MFPIQDTDNYDGNSTSDDSDAIHHEDNDDDYDHEGGHGIVATEEAIVLDDDDDADQERDGCQEPAQELAHPAEPVVPELSAQPVDEVDECPVKGDEVLEGDGEKPQTQEAVESSQQEQQHPEEEEVCPVDLLTSFDDADVSDDEEEKEPPPQPDSETPKNDDKKDVEQEPVTSKKGWKDLPSVKHPTIAGIEKKLAALRRKQSAVLLGPV